MGSNKDLDYIVRLKQFLVQRLNFKNNIWETTGRIEAVYIDCGTDENERLPRMGVSFGFETLIKLKLFCYSVGNVGSAWKWILMRCIAQDN